MRHFTFGLSAAGSMRQALDILGRMDLVFSLDDDLSHGPIDPPSPSLRAAWVTKELGYDVRPGDPDVAEWETDVQAAISGEPDTVIWVCRKNAREYCGFLELISCLGDQSYLVVDVTNEQFERNVLPSATYSILGLGDLDPEAFIRNSLFEKQKPLSRAARDDYLATWARLRAENAAFRIVMQSGLMSAPIDHFDAALMSHITPRWQKMARIIGLTLMSSEDFGNESTFVLESRLRALAQAGKIEMQGSGTNIRGSEVRLPP